MLIERGIAANTSTDVMVGTYMQPIDPALDPANSVLPQKIWVEVGAGGNYIALKVRNTANDDWITIHQGAVGIYSDLTVPAAVIDRTVFTGTEDQDELLQLMKTLLKRGGATEI